MILLNGSDLNKSFGGEDLFTKASFSIDSGDKIGFVGVNGAGKSTLIEAIAVACGTPMPSTPRVVHAAPGPTPTFAIDAPALTRSRTPSAR